MCTEANCTIQLKDVVVWDAKIVLIAMILGRLCLGKEDSRSSACSQECCSRSSANVKLYCVSYFYVFLQLGFLMIFRYVFPVRCPPRFIFF